jgi:hypothetical protein
MRETQITLSELALIAGTRGMLGAGLGLLLADHMQGVQRKAVGWTLFTVGLLTTIPLAIEVFGRARPAVSTGNSNRAFSESPAFSR